LLTNENTESARAAQYANEQLKNFCKLANCKPTEHEQTIKNRFWLWLSIVWKILKLTRYQSKQFSFITFQEQRQKLTHSTSLCEQIIFIHSAKLFSTLNKLTFSISSGHTTTSQSHGSYSLPYSLPSLREICNRISPDSPIWSGNVTTSTREPPTRARIRADIWRQDGAICSKNRKIAPYHGCARILRLTVSIPDYGSWSNMMEKDISNNLYQKCLILCDKNLLNVLHNMSATVWLPWQHTGFQISPILKTFLATFGVPFLYLHMVPHMLDPASI